VSDLVLDASALLAMINAEPGSERVLRYMAERSCVASSVNVAEVVARLSDHGGSDRAIAAIIEGLGIEIAAFNEEDAMSTGLLRSQTRRAGLSLGDRACIALARKLRLPAVTADRAWVGLIPEVDVEAIR